MVMMHLRPMRLFCLHCVCFVLIIALILWNKCMLFFSISVHLSKQIRSLLPFSLTFNQLVLLRLRNKFNQVREIDNVPTVHHGASLVQAIKEENCSGGEG